jgi:hypothetical protein
MWAPAPDLGLKGLTALEAYRQRHDERNRKIATAAAGGMTPPGKASRPPRKDVKLAKARALSKIDAQLENIRLQEERIIRVAMDRQKMPLMTKGCFFPHEINLGIQGEEAKRRHDFFVPPKPSKEDLALQRSQSIERLSRARPAYTLDQVVPLSTFTLTHPVLC